MNINNMQHTRLTSKSTLPMPSKELKEFLSIAATFRDDFSLDWIESLLKIKASELLNLLDESIETGWIVKKKLGIYKFKDPDEKQKLYNSISDKKKEKLHRFIAEILLKSIPSEMESVKAASEHLFHVKNDLNGLRIIFRAAELYRKGFEQSKAFQCYEKIMQDLDVKKSKATDHLFIETAIAYSKLFKVTSPNIKKAIKYLQDAEERAITRNFQDSIALIKLYLSRHLWMIGKFDESLKTYDQADVIIKSIKDSRLNKRAELFDCFRLFMNGRYIDSVEKFEKIRSQLKNYRLEKLPLFLANIIGLCYGHLGNYSQGLGMLNAVRSYSRDIGDIDTFYLATATISALLVDMGKIQEAIHSLESLTEYENKVSEWRICEKLNMMTFAYFLINDIEKSYDCLSEYLRHKKEKQYYYHQDIPVFLRITWAMENGAYPKVKNLSLESEINTALNTDNFLFRGMAYRYKGLLELKRGKSCEVVTSSLYRSLELLQTSGDQMEIAYTKIEIGRALLSFGDKQKAKEMVKSGAEYLLPINKTLVPDDLFYLASDVPEKDNFLDELLHLTEEIVSISDIQELLQTILSAINRLTGAERNAIFIVDEDGDPAKLELIASRNLIADEIEKPAFEISMKLIQKTAAEKKPFIHNMADGQDDNVGINQTIQSCVCMPMTIKDKTIGVLYQDYSILRRKFAETDLPLFKYLSTLIANSVLNAKKIEELENKNRKLEEEKDYYLKNRSGEYESSKEFIVKSSKMKKALDQAMRVAESDSNVLILGETGVGKEMVAREIHNRSPRREGPFITVHCSTFPKDLLPSELFGHEKGAFSGAVAKRIGRFELADGGTLFLDELNEIPLDVQVRLLRVLQSKEFERVGGEKTLRSDFRLLAATNVDLLEAVKNGMFREDLYYRINVYPIVVPPLRERKNDIQAIADYYLKIYSSKSGKMISDIPDEEMAKLLDYNWPGNVRELKNVIERSMILSSGAIFNVLKLEASDQEQTLYTDRTNMTLAENERIHILNALKQTEGKIRGKGGAAELLDINYGTLYARMKKLCIEKWMYFK